MDFATVLQCLNISAIRSNTETEVGGVKLSLFIVYHKLPLNTDNNSWLELFIYKCYITSTNHRATVRVLVLTFSQEDIPVHSQFWKTKKKKKI